jgi:hypothetical protein
MLYGLYVITLATGLSCHHRPRRLKRELDTSVGVSGQHDFSVRHERVRYSRHRVTASHRASVTIAIRPSIG